MINYLEILFIKYLKNIFYKLYYMLKLYYLDIIFHIMIIVNKIIIFNQYYEVFQAKKDDKQYLKIYY